MLLKDKINRRIKKYEESIVKFSSDKTLDKERVKEVVFLYKTRIEDLKWVIKNI
jgi:hypothetical protein